MEEIVDTAGTATTIAALHLHVDRPRNGSEQLPGFFDDLLDVSQVAGILVYNDPLPLFAIGRQAALDQHL